jgi:hypothetical protein
MVGTSQRLVFVPQINTVLLLGAPMAASEVGKDLDIFAVGAVSLYNIL